MGKLTLSGHLECEVGGVYHLCYFCTQEIQDIIDSRKEKENDSMNGQIFPYIAHYLTTGDLIYPAHEGDDHISSLLEEIGRLDLVRKLFPNQKNTRNHSGTRRTSGKGLPSSDCSTTLRIKTKEDRWVSRTLSRILRLPKSETSKSPPVYRPPPQHYKGTTIVVLRSSLQGNVQVRVHGPSTALKSFLPHELTVIGQTTHHHLNSHVVPSNSSAHSVVMSLEEQGFVVTVRSSRVEGKTGALITQWLLYRRSNKKLTPNGTSRRSSSLGKALGTARKNSRSLSISRKLISRSSSTLQSGSTVNLDSEVFRSNVNLSVGDDEVLEQSDLDLYNETKSKIPNLRDALSDTETPSPDLKTSNTKSLRPSLLYKSMSNLKESTLFSDKLSNNKLSSQKNFNEKNNIIYVQTMGDDVDNLRSKSFSSDSITSYPNKKVKHSASLWNLCPKTSVKRFISILF